MNIVLNIEILLNIIIHVYKFNRINLMYKLDVFTLCLGLTITSCHYKENLSKACSSVYTIAADGQVTHLIFFVVATLHKTF